MSSCIATSRYVRKLMQLFNSLESLRFRGLYLVTKVLLNLDRLYSILATIQHFKLAQFVTFCKRVYKTEDRVTGICEKREKY